MTRRNVQDPWTVEVLRSHEIGDACRVLLLALAPLMTEKGAVSIPRDQLAGLLDRHPARITERLIEAKRAGLLDQTGPGYRGRTATYVAVLPARKVTGERSPIAAKGDGSAVTSSGHLSGGAETATRPGKVTGERSPNARARVRVPTERDNMNHSEPTVEVHREPRDDHDGSRDSLDHDDKSGSNEEQAGTRLPVDAAVALDPARTQPQHPDPRSLTRPLVGAVLARWEPTRPIGPIVIRRRRRFRNARAREAA